MSLRPITLKTDKSITPVSDDTRVLRSTEKGLVLDVTILNEDDSPYDLTGKNVSFSEIKESDRVVADDGTGEQSGKFTMIDQTKGHFSYQMTHQCYTASGTCFFQIKQDDTIVDTTQDFYFQVKVDPTVKPINDSYVSSLIAMENHLLGATQKTQATIDQLNKDSSNAQQQAQAVLTKINSDFTDYSNKYNTLAASWQAQEKAINDAANKQLADLKTSNQADITAAVKSITDQRDAALKQLNDDKTKALADLQSDYTAWKTSTVKDFNDTVQPLKDSISENDQKLTTVSKQVSDTVASMDSLKQRFDKVDFSKFVTGDTIKNYYTKKETDLRLQQAGKVKSVDNIQPDSNGNINTDHYTQSQTDQKLGQKITFVKCDSPQAAHDVSMNPAADDSIVIGIYDMNDEPSQAVVGDQKINIEWLYNHLNDLSTQVSGLSSLQSLINGKADSADVYTKIQVDQMIANAGKLKTITVNGGAKISPDGSGNANLTIAQPDLSPYATKTDTNNLSNRIAALENKKPIKASSQDDAVAKSQSSSNEYYW